jgi:hypothetical protein
LVNAHYRQDYHIWKRRLDANKKGHWLFSWSLEGSFWHCQFQLIHRSSSEYSICPYCQSCRTQVVARISHHISQLQQAHTT